MAGFDEAAAAGDLGGMAKSARIMAEFRRGEAQLVQVRQGVGLALNLGLSCAARRSTCRCGMLLSSCHQR